MGEQKMRQLTLKDASLIKAMLMQKLDNADISNKEMPNHSRNEKIMKKHGITQKILHKAIVDVPICKVRPINHKGTKYSITLESRFGRYLLSVELEMQIDRHGFDVWIANVVVKN